MPGGMSVHARNYWNCETHIFDGIGGVDMDDIMVHHPPHYQSKAGLETINVIDAFTVDLTGVEAYDTGNIIKYICRWKHKNGLQDLEKAKWYLQHLINHITDIENNKKGE